MKIFNYKIIFISCSCFLAISCAQKITFHVTKPPKLSVKNVENLEIGKFENESHKMIPLPELEKADESENTSVKEGESPKEEKKEYQPLTPTITELVSNQKAANIVRGLVVSGLSKSGQYRLLNTEEGVVLTGVLPDVSKTAVLSAKVRYFEHTGQGAEELSYILIAKKGNLPFMQQMGLELVTAGVVAGLESAGKGFKASNPYIEKLGAMEVEFHLSRKGDSSAIVPAQTHYGYYLKKWGGDQDGLFNLGTSHIIEKDKKAIIEKYPADESLYGSLMTEFDDVQLAIIDPDEFLARGGNLKQHLAVPETALDIKHRLAKMIVDDYLQKISKYSVEAVLEVAAGDSVAVNYMNGNAYEKAINRLEGLEERSEADSYNLALSYESIGERSQATKYYQEALDKNPENAIYKEAIDRNNI
jgi:tetratricopeptide (TPR) repeat protein